MRCSRVSKLLDVKIEIAGVSDVPQLGALHYLSHTTSFAVFASPEWVASRQLENYVTQWTDFLSDSGGDSRTRAWKAVDGESIVGMVRVSTMCATEAQLTSMHVHPDWHRRGIGGLLMNTAVSFMRDAGFETATLGVIQANTAARTLYERGGWQVAELRSTGVEGVPAAVYKLSLKS